MFFFFFWTLTYRTLNLQTRYDSPEVFLVDLYVLNSTMCHVKVRLSSKAQICGFSRVFFQTAVFLVLIRSCRGQSEVFGSSQPIAATLGDDIILPCHLQPAFDALDMTVEWTRPDPETRYVYVWRDRGELQIIKHPSYKGRTSLFINELKHGNISLKLSKVKLSDEGTYRCFVPELARDSTVQLVVGAFSSPGINLTGLDNSSSGVVLQCESKGWYPEPEVLWLDGEENVLNAAPTETVRGPDDLYTVSSRVTVDKRHGNRFTCRVQQNNINQTRETHIEVKVDFFSDLPGSASSAPVIIGTILGIMCLLAGAIVVWKWKKTNTKIRSNTRMKMQRKMERRAVL
ncbi:butyrophilin-like protein 10 isoform X1 [Channa argus]|uniref:butyrophilin-like protein 10 isoform X1 n=1 Tax=Channa argus TaxID=215402 RepID=UPI0035218EC8